MNDKDYIELLNKFLRGLANEEEVNLLKVWIAQPLAREVCYNYYTQVWQTSANEMDRNENQQIFQNLLEKIDSEEYETNRSRFSLIRKKVMPVMSYIAVASVSLIVGVCFHSFWNTTFSNDNMVTVAVENGQKASVKFVDGTTVFINSASKLCYDASYNQKERILSLEGEAYFEVAKNKNKPFIVKVNGLDVEALGTSFNVRSYPTDKRTTVTLLEGLVSVKDEQRTSLLNPNERLDYYNDTKSFEKGEINPNSNTLLWRSNQLTLDGESLFEICQILTQMYDVDFQFANQALKSYSFRGLIKNNSLDNVLDFITLSAPVQYKKGVDNVIILESR